MTEKYFLYIDILNFANLVKSNSRKVNMLYKIIDSLNVHQHPNFNTIVFSDTILVYTDIGHVDPKYFVMYACEFAQDLQHRLIGQHIFFRAILVFGKFNHYHLKHIECFYGQALIDAYFQEKDIPAIGLFIDNTCNKNNDIFPTERFNDNLSFVYLNQSLERLQSDTGGTLPIVDPFLLEETEAYWEILWDIKQLQDIHYYMNQDPNPIVRTKHLTTWHLFRRRYQKILDKLEADNFSPNVICNKVDWSERIKLFKNEIKYFSNI